MKIKFTFIVILFCAKISAQNANLGFKIIVSATLPAENSSFYIYSPAFIIKAIYRDTLQAKNIYPEELMISIFSADNQAWVNYNNLGGNAKEKSKEHFSNVKKMDKEKNYFELHHKYEFIYNNKPTAIIKYYMHLQALKKPISAFVEMQNINGRWFQINLINNAEFSIMLMRFNSDKLGLVFLGKEIGDERVDKLIRNTRDKVGNIDLSALQRIYYSWYDNNDLENLEYFIDKNAW